MPKVIVVDRKRRQVVNLSLSLSRDVVDVGRITESLPDLQKELRVKWPVEKIRLLVRNPVDTSQVLLTIVIGLVTWIAKPTADKMRDEALNWLHRRFRTIGSKKAKQPKRRNLPRK